MRAARCEITKEEYEEIKLHTSYELERWLGAHRKEIATMWAAYWVYRVWAAKEKHEGETKYWIYAHIGDCCD
jgi:hypothetical protein